MFELPTMKEIAEEQARRKSAGDSVRMMSDESDAVEAGHFYTVSKTFNTGDGSWTELFWEVLAVCGPNAFVRIHDLHGRRIERLTEISMRAWYLADDAYALRSVEDV